MEYTNFTLRHSPLGNEQPYCQQTIERIPRHPVENEPVILCAMTDPVDAAERVTLLWSRDNWNETFSVEAVCLGNSDSVGNRGCDRYWSAVIPGQSWRDEIVYKFIADSGLNITGTGQYKYRPRQRVRYDTFESCQLIEGSLCVIYRSSLTREEIALWVIPADSDHLSLSVGSKPDAIDNRDARALKSLDEKEHSYGNDSYIVTVDLLKDRLSLSCLESGDKMVVLGKADAVSGEEMQEVTLYFESSPEEGFYGFGERYNSINQRGHIVHNRVYEQYTNQRLKTYMPIPFMFSSKNFGIYLDTDREAVFDLCSLFDSEWSMKLEKKKNGPILANLFFGGPKEILGQYSNLTGKPAALPSWAFGLWMSGNEWNTQERVEEMISATEIHDIPAKVLVIEAWSDEATFYIWNGAKYEPRDPSVPPRLSDFDFTESRYWPDPKGMIDRLHEKGIKLVLWQIPVLKAMEEKNDQLESDKAYAIERGLCALEKNRSPYRVRPGWFQGSYLADFSNPETSSWWMANRKYLLSEMGIDGFKTDGGEHLWGNDVTFFNGKKGDEVINSYPMDYIGTYHRFMVKENKGHGLIFSRAGYRGAQRFPCHWAGDQNSTWLALRSAVIAMLNSGLSGIPFIGWDMGGFSGEIPSSELYLRSVAVSVFCPVMQYHTENNGWREPCVDRTPWNLAERLGDDNLISCFREWVRLRERLIPYIGREAAYSCETGEPLMRSMLLDFWGDDKVRDLWDQYLFGRSLLVAPVFEQGAQEREVYLPEGQWTDCWTGKEYSGSSLIICSAPIERIPLFLRGDHNSELLEGVF